ncbi:hypothetical protein SMF913_25304 [Streptomyces malaysiensis]|uniref:Uncharacterized protein n=1 Tax=Streptomyces malaysiensis TaxID=92644 RepID=A0A2J7YPI4_STRMQ|nr:hypothetical protein SMF913_25304 [Streptomyces malaysiensis]
MSVTVTLRSMKRTGTEYQHIFTVIKP